MLKKKTSKKYCKACGYKVRGKNHKDGDHHNKTVPQLKGKG